MADLVAAVTAYADRFHRAMSPGHAIASPLGAWLVLALTGSAARDAAADRLGEVLGLDASAAADAAAELLAHPHDAVAAAAAMWHRPVAETDALRGWADALPAAVERGDVPSQDAADRWARERTYGLIERFPLPMTPDVLVVLASALATKVSWRRPFDTVAADVLGATDWHVGRVLRSPPERRGAPGHLQNIARTRRAGEVAVHRADSATGLAVTSVIAPPDVAAPDVLAAAHEVATGHAQRLSLFDLPLPGGHSWTLREEPGPAGQEQYVSVLPAWEAHSRHLLSAPEFGFGAAAAVLDDLLARPGPWDAAQAAMARYTRVGFEAAAVTGMARLASLARDTPGMCRVAELRFARPYAVVATATGGGPWDGLPVFSAWVAEPSEAVDD